MKQTTEVKQKTERSLWSKHHREKDNHGWKKLKFMDSITDIYIYIYFLISR